MRIVKGPCLINIGPNPISLPRVQRTSGKKCVHCASIKLCSPSARTLEGDKGVPPFGILIFYSSTNFILT